MIVSGVIQQCTAFIEVQGDPAYKTVLYSLHFAGKYTTQNIFDFVHECKATFNSSDKKLEKNSNFTFMLIQ